MGTDVIRDQLFDQRSTNAVFLHLSKNQHITDKVMFVDPIPEYGVRTTAIHNILVCNKIQRNDVRAPQCIPSLHGNMCKGMFSVDAPLPIRDGEVGIIAKNGW